MKEPICKKCGKPIRNEENELCYDCGEHDTYFEQGKSIWLHEGPVRWSIYQFKYHNRRMFGEFYTEEMYRLYGKKIADWKIDAIVPVPLHWRRKRKHGYNQAEIIAKLLGKKTGINVNTNDLVRTVNTKPQKKLSHSDRKKNLQNAFGLKKMQYVGKNILIIDDIYTSGSTINSIAELFVKKGAAKVFFLTISIGQGF